MPGLLELLEEARRTRAFKRAHDVTLSLLLVEFDDESLFAKLRGLLLLALKPASIHFSRVHIDTHLRKRSDALRPADLSRVVTCRSARMTISSKGLQLSHVL